MTISRLPRQTPAPSLLIRPTVAVVAAFVALFVSASPALASSPTTNVVSAQVSVSTLPTPDAVAAPKNGELGFVETYFPFGMVGTEQLGTPAIAVTWIVSIFTLPIIGWVVGDLVMLGAEGPKNSDALTVSLIETAFLAGAILLTLTGIGAIVGIPLFLAVEFWFAPVAMMNAWARGLNATGKRGASAAATSRRKKRAMAMAY